jgi:hypothetical protein
MQKPKLNRIWHGKNRMPEKASLEERAEWHLRHAKNCGCREMPKSIKAYLEKRSRPAR